MSMRDVYMEKIMESKDMVRNFRLEIRQLLDKMNSDDPEAKEELKDEANMKIDALLDAHLIVRHFRLELHKLLNKMNSNDPDAELKHEANMKIDALLDTDRELLTLYALYAQQKSGTVP
jgi:hypothetical protein